VLPRADAQAPAAPPSGSDAGLTEDIVIGSRILADFGVLDGFGHVSARDPRNPNRFLLSRSLAPALVTADDIMEFDLDGSAVDPQGRSVFLERFIHSEIYKARPDVMSVVHTHSAGVIPFGVSQVQLRPMYHNAAFLATGAPVSASGLPSSTASAVFSITRSRSSRLWARAPCLLSPSRSLRLTSGRSRRPSFRAPSRACRMTSSSW